MWRKLLGIIELILDKFFPGRKEKAVQKYIDRLKNIKDRQEERQNKLESSIKLLILLLLFSYGCAAKVVLLPKDAAEYYQKWQKAIEDQKECEEDLDTLAEACNNLLPQVP